MAVVWWCWWRRAREVLNKMQEEISFSLRSPLTFSQAGIRSDPTAKPAPALPSPSSHQLLQARRRVIRPTLQQSVESRSLAYYTSTSIHLHPATLVRRQTDGRPTSHTPAFTGIFNHIKSPPPSKGHLYLPQTLVEPQTNRSAVIKTDHFCLITSVSDDHKTTESPPPDSIISLPYNCWLENIF